MSPRRISSRRSVSFYGPALGRHIQGLRRARGWTQKALAERSDISTDTVRRLESGAMAPNIDTLVRLCAGLDLLVSRFFAALELPDNDVTRDVIDLLGTRPPREQTLAINMLRALFANLDDLRSGDEPSSDDEP